jgi:predicted hydrocarbon binding protein
MGRVLLQATEDVLGRGGLLALLQTAGLGQYAGAFPLNNLDKSFPFEDVSALMQGIDLIYGPRGGRGIGLRVGRVAFRYGLVDFGPVLGVGDLAVSLLPFSLKLNQGAAALAVLFNQFSDQVVRVEDSEEKLYWHIDRCPLCWGRALTEPRCFVAAGVLQEAMLWLSGGKSYAVTQTACRAAGHSHCVFEIGKKSLG